MHDALDRWSGLTVADPVEVREMLLAREDVSLRLDDAAAIARQVDAGRFILGDLNAAGDSLRIQVSLYRALEGARLHRSSVSVPASSRPSPEVFAALADSLLFRGAVPTDAPSSTATRSLPARQAFADGQRALATWDLERADAAFASATTFDPAYAQGFLWSTIVRWWRGTEHAHWRVAAEQARLGRDRMDASDRAMTEAMLALAGVGGGRLGACL
jgi:hypothetical protein